MSVSENILAFLSKLPRDGSVRLVAVSKTKPAAAVLEAYNAGQLHFGENYVQELIPKAAELPRDIKWHMIGHLQSNKAAQLVRDVPNLWMVETVDSSKLADILNSASLKHRPDNKLHVLVEVATSEEDTKSGVTPSETAALVRHIITNCPMLRFSGLMTIADPAKPTECFTTLATLKTAIEAEFALQGLELSMGMSADWEDAVKFGSTEIRVGSAIFGYR